MLYEEVHTKFIDEYIQDHIFKTYMSIRYAIKKLFEVLYLEDNEVYGRYMLINMIKVIDENLLNVIFPAAGARSRAPRHLIPRGCFSGKGTRQRVVLDSLVGRNKRPYEPLHKESNGTLPTLVKNR